jgi:hypothetical protein
MPRSVMLLLAGAIAGCAADLAQIKAAANQDIVAHPAGSPHLKAATAATPPPTMIKGFEECTYDQLKAFTFCSPRNTITTDICLFYINEASAFECYLQVPCVNAKDRMSRADIDICTHPTYNERLKAAEAQCPAVASFFSTIATVRDRDCARTRKPTSAPTSAPTSTPPTSRDSAINKPSPSSNASGLSAAFVLLAITLLGLER